MTKMIEVPEEHLLALKEWHDGKSKSGLIHLTVALIAYLPKPIEVGSRVRRVAWGSDLVAIVTVIAIDGDDAWVRSEKGSHTTWLIKDLEVIE